MAEGRSEANWGLLSHLLALLANVNRDPRRSAPLSPSDFDPHARAREKSAPTQRVNIKDIKDLLMGMRPPREPFRMVP